MDPTAQNNSNKTSPQSDNSQAAIQPGQFVVAGEDAPAQVQNPIATQENPVPQPTVSLAGERPTAPDIQVTPNSAASGVGAQPDPTPFIQPPPGQASQEQTPAVQPTAGGESSKKGGGIKTIITILAFVVLAGIITAVVYFFVLPMIQNKNNESTTDEQIIETSPTPPTSTNNSGFGDLPESTTTPIDTMTEPGQLPTIPTEDVPVDPLTPPTQ